MQNNYVILHKNTRKRCREKPANSPKYDGLETELIVGATKMQSKICDTCTKPRAKICLLFPPWQFATFQRLFTQEVWTEPSFTFSE